MIHKFNGSSIGLPLNLSTIRVVSQPRSISARQGCDRYRERRRDGLQLFTVTIPNTIIESAIARGLLAAELVPRHGDFGRLGQSNSGRCLASTSSSMLRGILGCLLMKPARSRVNTIW